MQTSSYNIKVHYAEIEEGGVINLPDMPDWKKDDVLEWDETENCLDSGEYQTLYVRNVSLEERMEADARAEDKVKQAL